MPSDSLVSGACALWRVPYLSRGAKGRGGKSHLSRAHPNRSAHVRHVGVRRHGLGDGASTASVHLATSERTGRESGRVAQSAHIHAQARRRGREHYRGMGGRARRQGERAVARRILLSPEYRAHTHACAIATLPRPFAQWFAFSGLVRDEVTSAALNGASLLGLADKSIPEIKTMFSVVTGELWHALARSRIARPLF